jgi:hypothetical protein
MRNNKRFKRYRPNYRDQNNLRIARPTHADTAKHPLPPLLCGIHGATRDIVLICRHLADAETTSGYEQRIDFDRFPCHAIT